MTVPDEDDFELPDLLPLMGKGPPPECGTCGEADEVHRRGLVLHRLQWRTAGPGNRLTRVMWMSCMIDEERCRADH